MASLFDLFQGRPKSIISFTMRIPEEMALYLKEEGGTEGMAAKAKEWMLMGAVVHASKKLGEYPILELANFRERHPNLVLSVKVLPAENPHGGEQ